MSITILFEIRLINYIILTRYTDAMVCKLRPILTKETNHKLEIARKEGQKRQETIKRQKAETMAAK